MISISPALSCWLSKRMTFSLSLTDMKKTKEKKKEKSKPSLPPPLKELEEEEEVDLKSLIREESLFFDKLVESIPARFYISNEKEAPWFQGLSKVAQASAKKETKENIKKARRDRLDPEKASLTTVDILHQTLEKKKKQKDKDDLNDAEIENPKRGEEEEDRSVTYEELKAKLHRKIEELRSNRHAGPDDMSNRMKKREINQGKRNRDEFEEKKSKPNAPSKVAAAAVIDAAKMEEEVAKASEGLAFSHVKIGNEDGRGRKRKKLSKQQELEEAMKLEEAKKDPEKGDIVSKKHSWKSATERAAGVKVHDDPKLVSKSIKKEKKKQQKNAEKWKERIETVEKKRAEKQQTRSEHISERVQQKKQRKIAKREKKLMRPGFEGRKEGYINGS